MNVRDEKGCQKPLRLLFSLVDLTDGKYANDLTQNVKKGDDDDEYFIRCEMNRKCWRKGKLRSTGVEE